MSCRLSLPHEPHSPMWWHTTGIQDYIPEEAAGKLAESARLPGFLHLYVGQEAVASGVCATLSDDDQITSTHRGHGHLVAKGGQFNEMMAELMGKSTGYCKGKGGSMHISNLDVGMLGANGIVGAGAPIAVGAGFANKYKGRAGSRKVTEAVPADVKAFLNTKNKEQHQRRASPLGQEGCRSLSHKTHGLTHAPQTYGPAVNTCHTRIVNSLKLRNVSTPYYVKSMKFTTRSPQSNAPRKV